MKNTQQPGPIQIKMQQMNGKQPASNNQLQKQRSGWTGFADKTLWDWMNLLGVLLVPLMVGVGTIVLMNQQNALSQAQHESDRTIANEQRQDDILKTYRDDINNLLTNHNIDNAEVRALARSYTYDALRRLNTERKGLLIRFLSGLRLVSGDKDKEAAIILVGTDLSTLDLSGVFLNWADLSEANLRKANLRAANLNMATLSEADLRETNLRDATLSGAYLYEVDLTDAQVSPYQLSFAISLESATMPDGTICAAAKNPDDQNEQYQIVENCVAAYTKSYDKDRRKYGGG